MNNITKKIRRFFEILIKINIKTIYFNFHYFDFKQAIKFPIFISNHTNLLITKGTVEIKGRISPGMILFGYRNIGIFDKKYSRSIWEVKGKVIFNGIANIGHGTKISVGPKGLLTLGYCFNITAESTIVCFNDIAIGNDSLISWDCLIMDTDFHNIYLSDGKRINNDRPIIIGNKNLIFCRSLILKGANLADGSVVAANSVVGKKFDSENSIIGGAPAKLIKDNIKWD